MQLFYHNQINDTTDECIFDAIESQHIVRVLRKKEGDILWITNGLGDLYKSEIIHAHDKRCRVKIVLKQFYSKNRNYYLQVVIAPTKNLERMEWFLEKATEIGIDEIIPIFCDHSERKVLKMERLEKVIIAAMKQSVQYYLPKLASPMKFDEFIKQKFDGQRFIAHCEETTRNSFKNSVKPEKNIQILIGPEGDFSPNEIEIALKEGLLPVTFGENRLRTETAGIVAVHTVALINEI